MNNSRFVKRSVRGIGQCNDASPVGLNHVLCCDVVIMEAAVCEVSETSRRVHCPCVALRPAPTTRRKEGGGRKSEEQEEEWWTPSRSESCKDAATQDS